MKWSSFAGIARTLDSEMSHRAASFCTVKNRVAASSSCACCAARARIVAKSLAIGRRLPGARGACPAARWTGQRPDQAPPHRELRRFGQRLPERPGRAVLVAGDLPATCAEQTLAPRLVPIG